jgi:hypothetical protein
MRPSDQNQEQPVDSAFFRFAGRFTTEPDLARLRLAASIAGLTVIPALVSHYLANTNKFGIAVNGAAALVGTGMAAWTLFARPPQP